MVAGESPSTLPAAGDTTTTCGAIESRTTCNDIPPVWPAASVAETVRTLPPSLSDTGALTEPPPIGSDALIPGGTDTTSVAVASTTSAASITADAERVESARGDVIVTCGGSESKSTFSVTTLLSPRASVAVTVTAFSPSARSTEAEATPEAGGGNDDGLKPSGGSDVIVTALSSCTLTVIATGDCASTEPSSGLTSVRTGGVTSTNGGPVRTRSTAAPSTRLSVISWMFAVA